MSKVTKVPDSHHGLTHTGVINGLPSQLRTAVTLLTMVAGILATFTTAQGANLPAGFTETQTSGLARPTAMDFAPDGRLFVCLQTGQLRVIKNGSLLPTPFLTVTTDSTGERGLLGVAFDPDFPANGFLYIYYTVTSSPRHNRVSRFTANGDVALANSEQVILELDNLSGATNHNGGALHFGPDGKLYIAVGENATSSNSQSFNNLLGKILRINSDGSIPSDNPFFNTATGKNRAIWALGLRNPFTFGFLPGSTRMFINDVGQNAWEEINDGIAGSNYGWPTTEGPTTDPRFRAPLFAYGHGGGATTGCAVTGGAFYNPAVMQFPSSFAGKYFFADLCSGWIRVLDPSNNSATGFATGILQPVDLKVSVDGSLYYLSIGSSSVFRVQFVANQVPPAITTQPTNQTATEGQIATFTVAANGTATLNYQWQRNGINIPGANIPTYSIGAAAIADSGATFRCVVTNAFGSATSNAATLTVTPNPLKAFSEETTDRAIALDSVSLMADPFFLSPPHFLETEKRTRIILFVENVRLAPGENASVVTAELEDQQHIIYPLTAEFVAQVPDFPQLTQIVLRLPDGLPANGDVFVTIRLRGVDSNRVRFRMR